MSQNIYQEKAIPLIVEDTKTKNLHIPPDTIKFLKSLEQPLGIVAVAGLYRTGKSYLLNKILLNNEKGFEVGPTVNPCTKGLWVWGKPIKGQTPDGEPINILVIDSEGLGALDQDSAHDSRIFALTILLSSCFIYNSVGSIDESAIENLSLIVNLTKHIHIKSQSTEEDEESEDFGNYFPSFIWVVRDFTLQLVDQDGDSITSKEYLEKSLQPAKGFSEAVDSKNRIRRLLNTFFRERDCYTLVRPLLDEGQLQNLATKDFKELRPEFVEQVISLRNRVINRMRPKKLNNQCLSGEMFGTLITSYVQAINGGSVPVIESAWTYICQSECEKAQAEAYALFEKNIHLNVKDKLPLMQEDLKQYYKQAKDSAMELFRKKAVGDIVIEYEVALIKNIKKKYNIIKLDNEKESYRISKDFLDQQYKGLENKLKTSQYNNFYEFEKDIRQLSNHYEENIQPGPKKREVFLEFLTKIYNEGSQIFLRTATDNAKAYKEALDDIKVRWEQEIKVNKDELNKERSKLLDRIADLETSKAEYQAKETQLKETIDKLSGDKIKMETVLKTERENDQKEMQAQNDKLLKKLRETETMLKEYENQQMVKDSEYQQQKALLEQKLIFIEKTLEERNKREKDISEEVNVTRREYSSQIKDISNRYESENKQQQQQIQQLQETVRELEDENSAMKNKYENELRFLKSKEQQLSEQLREVTTNYTNLQGDHEKTALNLKNFAQNELEEKNRIISDLTQKLNIMEQTYGSKEDNVRSQRSTWDKDKAILNQKIVFLEQQLGDANMKYIESKKTYEQTMKAFQDNLDSLQNRNDPKQIVEIRESHRMEISKMEIEYESVKKKLYQQVDQLNERNNELELKIKLEDNEQIKTIEKLREQLQELEEQRNKLIEEKKQMDIQKMKLIKEVEDRYQQKIQGIELQYSQEKEQAIREINEIQRKSEIEINQLRQLFAVEKERLEIQINEIKVSYERKIVSITEEYEIRIREDLNNYEEENHSLQDELKELEIHYQNIIQNYEHELSLKIQSIESLEKYLKEAKENISSISSSHQSTIESHISTFNMERNELLKKIEKLTSDNSSKDKDIYSLKSLKDTLEEELQKKDSLLDNLKKEFHNERLSFNERIEEAKSSSQKNTSEFMEKKIVIERELALTIQQNEFMKKKIDDLSDQLNDINKKCDEKIKLQKEEFTAEIQLLQERFKGEKELLEQKGEQRRKALKELEQSTSRIQTEIEKEKAVIIEKLTASEQKRNEIERKYMIDVENLQNQINQLRESFNTERKSYQSEIERLKRLILDLEQDNAELLSNYEKDKAISQGKIEFLEKQRDQVKEDFQDLQKKFELTIQQFQRFRNTDKEEIESSQNALIASIEQRYQSKIQELSEVHNQVVQDMQEKVKKYEKEIRNLNDKVVMDNQGKIGNQNILEKKITELIENERRLNTEIDQIKFERDQKMIEYQKILDEEREKLKIRISECEFKYKESESKRGQVIFEHEKERAKWNLEKDHFINTKNELNDIINKLERKKEALLRENERLKNENRTQRRANISSVIVNQIQQSSQYNKISRDHSPLSNKSKDKSNSDQANSTEIITNNTNNSRIFENRRNTQLQNSSLSQILSNSDKNSYDIPVQRKEANDYKVETKSSYVSSYTVSSNEKKINS